MIPIVLCFCFFADSFLIGKVWGERKKREKKRAWRGGRREGGKKRFHSIICVEFGTNLGSAIVFAKKVLTPCSRDEIEHMSSTKFFVIENVLTGSLRPPRRFDL